MKRHATFVFVLALSLMIPPCIQAQEESTQGVTERAAENVPGSTALFNVARFVIAGSVENREPVGIVNAFASSTEKVYCFLEARDIREDTTVSFVWYFDEIEKAHVTLPLRKGSRWRTYSSKKIGGLKGDWKVELQDSAGSVLDTADFMVE